MVLYVILPIGKCLKTGCHKVLLFFLSLQSYVGRGLCSNIHDSLGKF